MATLAPSIHPAFPRYAGAATFARLPRLDQVAKADVAVVGVPFDSGVSYRPGARFGANHVREASGCCGPTTRPGTSRPFEKIQVADAGDIAVNPFNIHEAIETIQQTPLDLTADGSKLVTLGGDHTIALPLLRPPPSAPAGRSRCCTSTPTWTPGTPTSAPSTPTAPRSAGPSRKASSTPRRISHVGTRGPLYGKKDLDDDHRFGFGIVTSADVYYQGVHESSPSSATGSATARSTSPSTSTCSTPPTPPAPAPRRPAASPAANCWRSCAASAA